MGHGKESLKSCVKFEETEQHDQNWAVGKITLAKLGRMDSSKRLGVEVDKDAVKMI